MTTYIEAMKLALGALDKLNKDGWILADFEDEVYASIDALRTAIEQAQKQEPIAWITEKIDGPTKGYMTVTFNKDTGWKNARSIPLYERPPQRQPMTDEEIAHATAPVFMGGNPSLTGIARAIEAAHGIKEKNT